MTTAKRQLEDAARDSGYQRIAGGDEAGRGPWAGPVCAAFVILPREYDLPGLGDSKELSRDQRRTLYWQIRTLAVAYGIGWATAVEIDRINILEATRLAFSRAYAAIPVKPDFLLLDFIKLPAIVLPFQAFPKGESLSDSIAAASILAKESRDCFMEHMDAEYPGYGFARHKGYGTAVHQKALREQGVCLLHRLSFKPVKKAASQ
jgi:ribonuclease HII